MAAREDDHRRAGRDQRGRSRREARDGARDDPSGRRRSRARRTDKRQGGFGPHGPPREPPRERRDDHRDHGDDARPPSKPAPLRIRGQRGARGRTDDAAKASGGRKRRDGERPRRRKRAPGDVETEVLRLGGRRGPQHLERLMEAAEAFANDRDHEALRILRPLRDALPDSPSVRELIGLAQYRIGHYRAAAKELERFVELTNSVEQHPVLMDCYRAQKRWGRVDELWEELAAASPEAALVTEGRIVAAGALADRGRLSEAIALLEKKADSVKRPRPDHLRLWYALADLEERAGEYARARALFDRVYEHDPEFADVATRRRTIGRS